jgi:nucleoside-diphosphate-sugar epimerase
MTQISILGCGWLGLPLGIALKNNGFGVKGSTTSKSKIALLQNAGIAAYEIALSTDAVPNAITPFLENSEILIIAIPPKLRGKNKDYTATDSNSFVKKIELLVPYIVAASIKKVLFISSTAVYGATHGNVDEQTPLNPDTESGHQMIAVESMLSQNDHFKTTILRFAGLIGGDRNPARFLSGKTNLPNPEAPINLIEIDDCIHIIMKIIEKDFFGKIYNAAAPFHPTRKSYYTQKAAQYHLPLPQFDETLPSSGKKILSTKLMTELEYSFAKPNL